MVELKKFMSTDARFIDMQRELVRYASIEPAVATYALLKTKMESIGRATDFIFDLRRGNDGPPQMHHPFVSVELGLLDENPSGGHLLSGMSFFYRKTI